MAFTSGGCRDLRKYHDDEKVAEMFGRLLSGRAGYKTVIEKRKEQLRCKKCNYLFLGEEKFCPECGTKVEKEEKKPEKIITTEDIEKMFKNNEINEEQLLQNLKSQGMDEYSISALMEKWKNDMKNMEANMQTQNINTAS